MSMQHLRFDPVVNMGHIAVVVTLTLTLGTIVWKQSEFQTRTDLTLATLTKTVEEVQAPSIEKLAEASKTTSERLTAIETRMDIGPKGKLK